MKSRVDATKDPTDASVASARVELGYFARPRQIDLTSWYWVRGVTR